MAQGGYRHLTFEEWEQIGIWRLERVSQAEMARRLGRKRCGWPIYACAFEGAILAIGIRGSLGWERCTKESTIW